MTSGMCASPRPAGFLRLSAELTPAFMTVTTTLLLLQNTPVNAAKRKFLYVDSFKDEKWDNRDSLVDVPHPDPSVDDSDVVYGRFEWELLRPEYSDRIGLGPSMHEYTPSFELGDSAGPMIESRLEVIVNRTGVEFHAYVYFAGKWGGFHMRLLRNPHTGQMFEFKRQSITYDPSKGANFADPDGRWLKTGTVGDGWFRVYLKLQPDGLYTASLEGLPNSEPYYSWENELKSTDLRSVVQFGGSGCGPGDLTRGCYPSRLDNVRVTYPGQPFFCDGGEYPDYKLATCERCPPGQISIAGDTQCFLCDPGMVPNEEQTACVEPCKSPSPTLTRRILLSTTPSETSSVSPSFSPSETPSHSPSSTPSTLQTMTASCSSHPKWIQHRNLPPQRPRRIQ
eukprot:gb/GECG01008113.1/.p1 GENE.gb/GECG01008113.1/~~gb/GECG01008113.1/.p1  ORF type:complete len:395 (+),score=16.80 gb/GECG01008113.1/:1-1185(+)